ncbi:MAG: hypothetical protein HYT72_01245 [Candidatus Aenigmarchaeota archaeon]|nr:hypothetical protein [Candidatus Aenigmarchaeota archaeon]
MTKLEPKKFIRLCSVCGKSIKVTVYKDGHYRNGHYFNRISLPIKGTGQYKKIGTTQLSKMVVDVVKWTGKERKVEYWECNKCYEEALHENWLEETLERLFGKRCKDYVKGCACCDAWHMYDIIVECLHEVKRQK